MMSTRTGILIVGLATLLVVPGPAGAAAPERVRPTALEGSSIPWCGDVEPIRGDLDLYADGPVYVYNNPHVREVQRWARQQPGYEDLWIDYDRFRWITLGFSEGADERQAELELEFPDIGVVAVDVGWSRKDLRRLQRRMGGELIGEGIRSWSTSVDFGRGMVEFYVGAVTEEIVSAVEAKFAGEPVCISGPDPSELPPPGPQPTEGDGWTLVGHQDKAGPPWFRTGIATKPGRLASLWAKVEMPGDPPVVDFLDSVVLWFAEPHGSGCTDLRLDDVIVDHERAIIHPDIVMPDHPVACRADLSGAHHFFVALERDRLPAAPFWIQLGPEDPPEGMPKERTVVEVDLTAPGSVTAKGDVHFDRERQQAPRLPERSGTSIGLRGNTPYAFDITCGIGYLGKINDIHWVTEDEAVPAEWEGSVDESGEVVVTVRLHAEPDPHVTANANGHSVRYDPVLEAPARCDA